MMDEQQQLKLQAYLDGELAASERREVEAWLARDPDATALLAELRQTGAVFKAFEAELKLPESREFFWSKIERGIRQEPRQAPTASRPSWLAAWRRLLVPVSAAAALALVLVVSLQVDLSGPAHSIELEMTLQNGNATTYRDQNQGMTLVWFSYPENDEAPEDDLDEFLFD
jgi:anti-sigma factor RsiW